MCMTIILPFLDMYICCSLYTPITCYIYAICCYCLVSKPTHLGKHWHKNVHTGGFDLLHKILQAIVLLDAET